MVDVRSPWLGRRPAEGIATLLLRAVLATAACRRAATFRDCDRAAGRAAIRLPARVGMEASDQPLPIIGGPYGHDEARPLR